MRYSYIVRGRGRLEVHIMGLKNPSKDHCLTAWGFLGGDQAERIFYPILTQIMHSFSCSPLNKVFTFKKKLAEVPEYDEMHHSLMMPF